MADDVKVWDPFVRIGHVVLIAGFAVAYVSGEGAAWLHEGAGYAVAATLVLRLAWGFVGPRHARFRDFVTGPEEVLVHLQQMLAGRAPRHLGHSPVGGAMVLALLASLAITALTGAMHLGANENRGPLAPWLGAEAAKLQAAAGGAPIARHAQPGGRMARQMHSVFAHVTLLLIAGHLGGVAFASFLHRENLPRAMLTGRKPRDPDASRR